MTFKSVIVTIVFLAVIGFALLGFARGCGVELANDKVEQAVDWVFNPLQEMTAEVWQ